MLESFQSENLKKRIFAVQQSLRIVPPAGLLFTARRGL